MQSQGQKQPDFDWNHEAFWKTSVSWDCRSVMMIIPRLCFKNSVCSVLLTMCIKINPSDLFIPLSLSRCLLPRHLTLFISSPSPLTQWRRISICIVSSHAMEESTDRPAFGLRDMAGPVQRTSALQWRTETEQMLLSFAMQTFFWGVWFLRIGTDLYAVLVMKVYWWAADGHMPNLRRGLAWLVGEAGLTGLFQKPPWSIDIDLLWTACLNIFPNFFPVLTIPPAHYDGFAVHCFIGKKTFSSVYF